MRNAAAGLAVALLVVACDGGEEGSHSDHDHMHEDEQGHHDHHHGPVAAITAWSDDLELFAEHPAAVAGEEVAMLAHLTVLEDFRALEDATVRLSLEGPVTIEAEASMLRSGIYEPHFTPPSAGLYQGRVEVIAGGDGDVGLSIGGFTVQVYESREAAEAAMEEEAEEDGAISLLKEQQWRLRFMTAEVETGSVAPGVEVAGELGTPPGGVAHVHAPVAGRVMAGREAFPTPGLEVEPGAELLTLAPTPGSPEAASQAASQVVDAEVQVEDARAALARNERMLADQAIPERRVEEARRRLRAAEAALDGARRARSLYATASRGRGRGTWRITSPIGGVVDEVRVSPGEAVESNELLLRVVDPRERWVTAFVPELWAARIRPEVGATFHLLGDDAVRPIDGRLVNVSSVVDERSRTVRVIWSLAETSDELRIGAAIRVSVPSGEPEQGVVIPRSAIVDVGGRQVAYVQVSGESFEERALRTGASDGARVLVVEGLEEGERVVTRGGYLVRLAATAGRAEGHAHGHPH